MESLKNYFQSGDGSSCGITTLYFRTHAEKLVTLLTVTLADKNTVRQVNIPRLLLQYFGIADIKHSGIVNTVVGTQWNHLGKANLTITSTHSVCFYAGVKRKFLKLSSYTLFI